MVMHQDTNRSPDQTSLGTLLQGIVADMQDLVRQQLSVFRIEVKQDLVKVRRALIGIGLGMAALFLGAALLLTSAAWGLNYAFPETLPLWAAFLIVGGAVTLIGIITLAIAFNKVREASPLTDKSVETLKENFRWVSKSAT